MYEEAIKKVGDGEGRKKQKIKINGFRNSFLIDALMKNNS